MRVLLTNLVLWCAFGAFGQVAPVSNACNIAQNICNNSPVTFPLSTGQSPSPVVPPAGSISNPNSNPAPGLSGCLLAGELNPNWFIFNVTSNGSLEFQIGAAGGNGYYDWSLWPYNPTTGCTDIQNNLVAPVACNWNASSQGFTGLSPGGVAPPGGVGGNFSPSFPVTAGQQYILMFSNYSSQVGNVGLTFPQTGASIGCSAATPDATICLGDQVVVDIITPPAYVNPSYNWLVTTGVSNPTGGNGGTAMVVAPTVTTEYHVEVQDNAPGGVMYTDTFTVTVVNPPAPNAGPDQNVCLGSLVTLSGTPDDPINNTTQWMFDASQVTPAPAVNFIPNNTNLTTFASVNQTGTYYFMLQETNAICGDIQDTLVVNVSDLAVSATFTSPSCSGFTDGTITVTAPGADQYSFDAGTTWIASNTSAGFGAGTYNVCASTPLGCQKCTDVTITEPAPMTISVSNDTLICENGTATMTASATGGTSYLFNWSHTGDTQATQDVMPGAATTYTVYAENQTGCVSPNATIDVTVRPPLSGTISPVVTICPGYPTDLSATVAGGIGQPYSFVWSDGSTFNGAPNHTINVNPPSTTDYTVTITDGCESTPLVMTTTVTVAPLPVPSVNVLNPVQCEPAIFDIVNTTDPSLSQFTYWLVDGTQQFLNQDTITTAPLWAGEYDVQLVVTSYDGCVDSLTWVELLSVDPQPVADFKYTPNPVLMFNTQVLFTNYSFNGYTYEWSFEDGIPSQSTQTNVQVLFPDGVEGRYDVQLITTSELGCIDTMDHELIVYPEVLIYAPNAFTPDGDEHNQTWRVFMEGIDVYDFELLIFDRWGEVVWESRDIEVGWDGTYNGRLAPTGTYTWIIRTKDLMNDAKYTYDGHLNLLK
ncbi:MAG: gliding motility-associated C-terminal domain-containing protein [Crocinitomicaceae bacterium]|nr:gliding motility-associated C-terminal domain-containing protein [Crocinitomicaceae bacterium]